MKHSELAETVERFVAENSIADGLHRLGLPNLSVFKKSAPGPFETTFSPPLFCLVLQGEKTTVVSKNSLTYSARTAIVITHELPIMSQVQKASMDAPYLALLFHADYGLLRSIGQKIEIAAERRHDASAFTISSMENESIDAFSRYFELLRRPQDVHFLEPLISREIHYRLLVGAYGGMLSRMLDKASQESRVEYAIQLIRQNYSSPLQIDEISREVGMSNATLFRQFKSVTSVSPIQYQKDLRLLEAKRILKSGHEAVSSVAYKVGYESPSQFSREYSRKYGYPPNRETQMSKQPAADLC